MTQHGKSVVVTLQNKVVKENALPFHLATEETTEELFEWYKVAWDISQREGNRELEVKINNARTHLKLYNVHKRCIRMKLLDY